MVYNLDEDDYIIKTRAKTKTETKSETETKNNIYSKIRFICKECHEEFRSKVALTTHSYVCSHVSRKHRRLRYKLKSEHERILYY